MKQNSFEMLFNAQYLLRKPLTFPWADYKGESESKTKK